MIKLDVSESTLEILKDFCDHTDCGYCPFGESGFLYGYNCLIEKPSEWQYEVEENEVLL